MPKEDPTTPTDTARARVDKLHARRAEIEAEVTAARSALASAQSARLDGKADASDAVTAAQARLSGAEGTLTLIRERVAEAEAQLEAQVVEAAVEALRVEMRAAASTAAEARDEEGAAYARLRSAFDAEVRTIHAAEARWKDASGEFVRCLSLVDRAGGNRHDAVARLEAEGVDLTAALSSRFQTQELPADFGPPRPHAVPRVFPYDAPDLGEHPDALRLAWRQASGRLAKAERLAIPNPAL